MERGSRPYPTRKRTMAGSNSLYLTLLHEHHDFFLVLQHPTAWPALAWVATKYNLPARTWRHGIHAILEVLRYRLPESLNYMLAFVYIVYSMMALLYEMVPAFEDTWIGCLGDLERHRMAIKETCSGVTISWYSKASDKSPKVGRLYYHLTIPARLFTPQQLSLFTKSLTCVFPFGSARGRILTLSNPVLDRKQTQWHRLSVVEILFIKLYAIFFTRRLRNEFFSICEQFLDGLRDSYIDKDANLLPLGNARGSTFTLLRTRRTRSMPNLETNLIFLYTILSMVSLRDEDDEANATFGSAIAPRVIAFNADPTSRSVLRAVVNYAALSRDVSSVGMLGARSPRDLYTFPGKAILVKSGMDVTCPGHSVPEDFIMRGHLWCQNYFPETWFDHADIDDEGRTPELPSIDRPRIESVRGFGLRAFDVRLPNPRLVRLADLFRLTPGYRIN